jgi:hypothetical protein
MRPFVLLPLPLIIPFALDFVTNSIEYYEKIIRMEELYLKGVTFLQKKLKLKEIKFSKRYEIIIIAETPSKGIITKHNIAVQWFITKWMSITI